MRLIQFTSQKTVYERGSVLSQRLNNNYGGGIEMTTGI